MIIDCHAHIGRNEHIKATAEELIKSMDNAGIDKALVFAGHINDCANKWMLEQIKPFKDRLYGVASVNLAGIMSQYGTTGLSYNDMSINDMLDALNQGAVALKLYTGYEHYNPNSERVRHVLEIVNGYNKPVIFHTGDCLASITHAKLKHAQPIDIDDVAVDYPKINFIIAHMGFPWHREAAEVCYKNANVYSDISGFVYGDFKGGEKLKFNKVLNEFMDIAGHDKLLFGTDYPISNQSSYINFFKSQYSESLTPEELSLTTSKVFNIK